MNRNLLASLLLLIAPLAAADVLPLPPPPVEDVDWLPTDAMGYGLGGGLVGLAGCPGTYTFAIAVFDETATDGGWSTSYVYALDPASIATTVALGTACSSVVRSPIFLESLDFDPVTGGCFGGDPNDADHLCLEFLAQDPVTGAITYHLENEAFRTGEPTALYSGEIQIAFAEMPDV